MKVPSHQTSTIVVLDDEPLWVENYVRFISRMTEADQIKVAYFYRDDLAIEFVQKHGHEITGFIQDLSRGVGHEYTGGAEGIRFLEEVIARYTPSARTLIVSGSVSTEALRRIYTSTPHEIDFIQKSQFDADSFRRAFLWLLKLKDLEQPKAPLPPVTPTLIAVMDLPWDEIRDYLTSHPDYLHTMNPRAFEGLVAEFFRTHGWEVELTAGTRDGGYDVIAVRRNQPTALRALIEAKRFAPDRPVGVGVVRALYAVRGIAHASQVVLATSSHVSGAAKQEFSKVVPWELDFVERDQILDWCRLYKTATLIHDGGV